MHYTPSVTRDSVLDLAAFLVRDLARYERNMEQARVFPRMLAKIEGERDGTRSALAYCAGMLGCGTVEEVVALARRERPTVSGVELRQVACMECADYHAADDPRCPIVQKFVAEPSWPVDHETGE